MDSLFNDCLLSNREASSQCEQKRRSDLKRWFSCIVDVDVAVIRAQSLLLRWRRRGRRSCKKISCMPLAAGSLHPYISQKQDFISNKLYSLYLSLTLTLQHSLFCLLSNWHCHHNRRFLVPLIDLPSLSLKHMLNKWKLNDFKKKNIYFSIIKKYSLALIKL